MAISATFELRENGGSKLYAAVLKSYTVIDLDYTLNRSFDKTGRPSSPALIDYFKITIRGTKEITAKFHEWIGNPDKLMDGIIKIYDSTGYATALTQDSLGGDTVDYLGHTMDLTKDEIEDNIDYNIHKNDEDENKHDDIFDEMDRTELLSYIASKNLEVKTSKEDTTETIRDRIRHYNKLCKMSEAELLAEAKDKKVTFPEGARTTKEDLIHALAEQYNEDSKNKKDQRKDEENPTTHGKPATETGHKFEEDAGKLASSTANALGKGTLESARSITFTNAYCISLREHFHGDPENKGKLDASYPWTIEIGIRPGDVEVTGWNMVGGSLVPEKFHFFDK